jgi:hypothetical protein|tara:strand:+ start:1017 stop:1271 length:255 start_codon:yes stop_codon:yes gene_type:complete
MANSLKGLKKLVGSLSKSDKAEVVKSMKDGKAVKMAGGGATAKSGVMKFNMGGGAKSGVMKRSMGGGAKSGVTKNFGRGGKAKK